MVSVSGGLVVVDPGTTTGVCVVRDDGWQEVKGRQDVCLSYLRDGLSQGWVETYELKARSLGIDGVASALADECSSVEASVTVHEDFILRTSDMKRETLDPVRISAAFCAVWTDRHFGGWRGLRFVYQQPSDMKTKFGGRKKDKNSLDRHGLWIVGSDHERDAMGHTALFLMKRKG